MDAQERRPRPRRDVVEILNMIKVKPAVDGEMLLAGVVVVGHGGHATVGAFGGALVCAVPQSVRLKLVRMLRPM